MYPEIAQARLSRFQGATAISSADFYDNGEGPSGGGGGGNASSEFDVSANELMSKLSFQARATVPINIIRISAYQKHSLGGCWSWS